MLLEVDIEKKNLISIYFLFVNNLSAFQCPKGYIRHTIIRAFSCGCHRCTVAIPFCCKWNPFEHKLEVIFNTDEAWFLRWRLCCYYLLQDTATYHNFIDTAIMNNVENICLGEYPPCDHPTLRYYEVEIKKPICVYYKNAFITPFPGEEPMWVLRVKRCSQYSNCIKKYRICIDYFQSPPAKTITLLETYITGNCKMGNCVIPPPGKTWEEEWETECCFRECR